MAIIDEAKKRALEMGLAADPKFDFQGAARAIAGTPMAATHAYGLSPENVVAQTQLGQQALRTKQQAVQQTVEDALQRDNQLVQKLQMAHQTVMQEKKFSLEQELAEVEKARAAASINASNAQAGLAGAQAGLVQSQTQMSKLNMERMKRELDTLGVAEKLVIPIPLPKTDPVTGETTMQMQEMPLLAAQAAGLNAGGIISSYIKRDQQVAKEVEPWRVQGFSDTDSFVLGKSFDTLYKSNLQTATRMAASAQKGLRAKPKSTEEIQQEALDMTLNSLKGKLSEEGMKLLKDRATVPQEKPQGQISPETIEALSNALINMTQE